MSDQNVEFLELSWVPTQVEQASNRCHRIGRKDDVMTYKYLMLFRPLSIGTQPKGVTAYTELPMGSRGYGILEYPDPLTTDELRDYELEEVKGRME